jgi:hypothetical protein
LTLSRDCVIDYKNNDRYECELREKAKGRCLPPVRIYYLVKDIRFQPQWIRFAAIRPDTQDAVLMSQPCQFVPLLGGQAVLSLAVARPVSPSPAATRWRRPGPLAEALIARPPSRTRRTASARNSGGYS